MQIRPGADRLDVALQAGRTADALWRTDRRAALGQMRVFSESLAYACGASDGLVSAPGEDLIEFLARLTAHGSISRAESDHLHTLRQIGNRALHGESLSPSDSTTAREAFDFLAPNLPGWRAGSTVIAAQVDTPLTRATQRGPAGSDPDLGIVRRGADGQAFFLALAKVVVPAVILLAGILAFRPVIQDILAFVSKPRPKPAVSDSLGGLNSYRTRGSEMTPVFADTRADAVQIARLRPRVIVQGDQTRDSGGVRWIRIVLPDGQHGWVKQDRLALMEPEVPEIRFGSPDAQGLLSDFREAGDYFGASPVAVAVDWRYASENKTSFEVQLEPQVTGKLCRWTAIATTGSQVCELGTPPAGAYAVVVSANGKVVRRQDMQVFPASGRSTDPSFDCAAALRWSERLICGNEDLAQADASLSLDYQTYLAGLGPAEAQGAQARQRRWISARERCHDDRDPHGCLVHRYEERSIALAKAIEATSRQSPELGAYAPAQTSQPSARRGQGREQPGRCTWPRQIEYPRRALERGHEGQTSLTVSLNANDERVACNIVDSSGDADLDRAACRAALRGATCSTARNGDGYPVPSSVPLKVQWRLPK